MYDYPGYVYFYFECFFQPKFLTKEERVALALARRQAAISEQKQKSEEERKKQMEFLKKAHPNSM